jgi:hypothetical protein
MRFDYIISKFMVFKGFFFKSTLTLENTEGTIKMDNPEKLVTYGTHGEEKQNKNTTQYVLDIPTRQQTQIT